MTSYINLFLKTEITCIPKLLRNYIGDYYNNALFNGATWVFVFWCLLHLVFDRVIDAFLKKLRYREYVRIRLKNSLWYLGFYGTAVVYSRAALAQNEVELFNFKKMHVPSSTNLPSQVVIGYTLISTFFLHSSLWEGLVKEYFINMLSYTFLFLFLVSSYILRIVEISFTLTALIGMAQVAIEFTRCCFMSSTQESTMSKVFVGLLYFATYLVCFAVYIVVIPLTFVVPLGLKIMTDYPNILLLFLFLNLILWLSVELYQSVLYKFLDHWFYHQEEAQSDNFLQCSVGLLECSLFKPRDDVSYNLQIIRKEIKARQAKMMSMRKPKNKTMLIQTLKCMVAIKKKLSKKRRPDSSDSDSEKSEESDLKLSENSNTDEHNGERLSDQDEETDDESQDSPADNKETHSNHRGRSLVGESDENEESGNEESASYDSDVETEKENNIDETDSDSKPSNNKITTLEHNNNETDENKDKEAANQGKEKLPEINLRSADKKHLDDNETVALHKGDNSAVQMVEETKYSSTLLVEGDNNAKEITESSRNVDDDNNLLTCRDDALKISEESANPGQGVDAKSTRGSDDSDKGINPIKI